MKNDCYVRTIYTVFFTSTLRRLPSFTKVVTPMSVSDALRPSLKQYCADSLPYHVFDQRARQIHKILSSIPLEHYVFGEICVLESK